MPLFHIHGLSTLFASLAAGASVVCTSGFSAAQFFECLEAFRPTWYSAAPTIHQAILENVAFYPDITARHGLRFIRSASAAMPLRVIADLEQTFKVPFIEAYGMTEAGPQIASNRLSERKSGSVGRAAGPEVAIMSGTGSLMPTGESGEIVIRGTNVMRAYENDPTANWSAFVREWFRTGDRGYLDTDGYLFITGRLKEIINRGGEKISPREVDEVMMEHPAVHQWVTFGMPHDMLGEEVAAAVVLKQGAQASDKELREFAKVKLADFKVPKKILILQEIPVGATGKLQRIGLAQKLGLG
jgi:acyl-CoA synthetase (AMP-forming)/AMP-acid ligase II